LRARAWRLDRQDRARVGLPLQVRHLDLLDSADAAQGLERALEVGPDCLLTANGDAFDHTEREPASGHLACVVAPLAVARARIVRIRTGNGLQHEAAVLRGERERPQLVERPAERHRAVPAAAAVARPAPR